MEPVKRSYPRTDIAVLMIAAGRGKRFGSDKRRAQLASGETLLEKSLACYQPFFTRVFVGVSACSDDDSIAVRMQALGATVVRCDNAGQGMGSTIADLIPVCENADATLIALGDMPLISAQILEMLLRKMSSRHIVYPVFKGQRGHPVVFGSAFFSELQGISGERGGSTLIQAHPASCIEVPVEDPGVLLDVDTPDDLRRVSLSDQLRSSAGASG